MKTKVMRISERIEPGSRALGAILLVGIALAGAPAVSAQDASAQNLVYATFDGENTAAQVFQTMKQNQSTTGERIQSYAIVSKNLKGKVKVHDQRKTDAGVGAAVGAVIGLVGGPVGALVGATAGGATGYLTGDAVGIPRESVDAMEAALTPGSSALVVVLEDRWVQDVEKGLREAHARQVIGSQIATNATSAGVTSAVSAENGSAQSLVYATYDGENTAAQVFQTMKQNQSTTGERIQSYAIVSKNLKGKVKVHDQRKTDAGVGAAVGAVIGLVGGPVGAVVGATAGGATGYLTGDAVGIPRESVDAMEAALTPGSSALVVVLEDRWVQDVEKGLREAHARQVIGSQIVTEATSHTTRP